MKKNGLKILSIILIGVFFISGCAKVEPISEDDEKKIAVYCAGIISKFNKSQNRGIVHVNMAAQTEEEEAEEADNDNSGAFPKDPTNVNAPTSDAGESELSKVIGISGMTVAYKDTVISKDYGSDGGFLINPQNGNSFVAVKYEVKNTTEGEIDCNIASKSLEFTATLGEVTSAVDRTILADDLTTYNEKIPAGESRVLTILFQFPTGLVSDLSGLEISCIKDGVRYNVPF